MIYFFFEAPKKMHQHLFFEKKSESFEISFKKKKFEEEEMH